MTNFSNFKLYLNFFSNQIFVFVTFIFFFICLSWSLNFETLNFEFFSPILRHEHYINPEISILIYKFIYSLFGQIGIIILGQILLPTISFYILLVIFSRYLNKIWSVFLTLLSVSTYTNFPFREYLLKLFTNNESINNLNINPPELMHFPIPALSTLVFLICFMISTESKYLSIKKTSLISILAIFLVFINAIDAIFFLIFWLFYFSLKFYRQKIFKMKFIKLFSIQLLLIIIGLSLLFFYNNFEFIDKNNYNLSSYYFLSYFIIPVTLIFLLSITQRIDIFEILFKFSYVYLFMTVEIFLILLEILGIYSINLDIMSNRISEFFLHCFYYVPVIYYSKELPIATKFGTESFGISKLFIKFMNILFIRMSYYYLNIFIFLLFAYLLLIDF